MRAFNGTARILVDPWYKWWVRDTAITRYTQAKDSPLAGELGDKLRRWIEMLQGTPLWTQEWVTDDAPGKPPF